MIDTVAVNVAPGETRIALLSGERTIEVIHHRDGRDSVAGNLYRGRILRVEPGLQAAFVDIGLERAGFLNADDARPVAEEAAGAIETLVHEGQAVLVQVLRDPIGRKGALLTMRPALLSRRLVYTPAQRRVSVSRRIAGDAERARLASIAGDLVTGDEGLVLRTAATGADRHELTREFDELRTLWQDISAQRRDDAVPACVHRDAAPMERALRDHGGAGLHRVLIDSPVTLAAAHRFCARVAPELDSRLEPWHEDAPLFERLGVEAAIEEALGRRIALPSGGGLVIEETEALTAVDVNVEGALGRAGAAANTLCTNLEAADEIARQIRLRATGGLIVIDFVRMKSAPHRQRVIGALSAALTDDPAASRPGGFTGLGLVEMTRRRVHPPLADILCEPCADRGRRKSPASVALDIARAVERRARTVPTGRLTVVAAPEVAAVLEAPPAIVLTALAERLGSPIAVRADASFERETYDIVGGRGNG